MTSKKHGDGDHIGYNRFPLSTTERHFGMGDRVSLFLSHLFFIKTEGRGEEGTEMKGCMRLVAKGVGAEFCH